MIKWDLSQGCTDSSTYGNHSMWYTTLTNGRTNTIWSPQQIQKNIQQNSTPFMIKTLQNVSMEGTYLNIIKDIKDKHTANIILNSEKLKAFSLRPGTRQRWPHSPLPVKIVLKSSQGNQRRKRNKRNKKRGAWSEIVIVCKWDDVNYGKS